MSPAPPKLLFDLSAAGALYKTGIPYYSLELSNALSSLGWDLFATIHEKILDSTQTQAFLKSFESKLEHSGKKKPFFTRARNFARRKSGALVRTLPLSARLEKQWRLKRSERFILAQRPLLQHWVANSTTHLFDLPLAFTFYDFGIFRVSSTHDQKNISAFKKTVEDLVKLVDRGHPVRFPVISEFTQREASFYLGRKYANLCDVTPLGVNTTLFHAHISPHPEWKKKRFVLSVGTLEPRKNHVALLQAFAKLAARDSTLNLVFVGARGWKFETFFEQLEKHLYRDRIHIMGSVDDATLASMYASCAVFCYPSLYEGFGLPVLEALSCGAPTVCSDAASLPEVGGDAVLYFDAEANDPSQISERIEQALAEGLSLKTRGLIHAQKFSWTRTAELTADCYRKLAPV